MLKYRRVLAFLLDGLLNIFKGKKMPGHLGDVNVTVQNLVVVDTDDENGYILVRGAVPGATGSVVCIYDAVKRALPAEAPVPASIKKSAKVETPAEEKVETTAETVESKE